ncbi:unnamed protein product [Heterobilharzia americana]|nr:unnamed protein product [Heterobilharzia americana]
MGCGASGLKESKSATPVHGSNTNLAEIPVKDADMKESPRHIVPSEAGKESDSISKDNQLKKSEVEAIYTKDEFTVPVSISSDVDEHAIKELNLNTVRLRKEDGYKDEVQEIYGPRNSTYQKSIFKEMNQDNLSIIEEIDQLSTELVAQNTNNHFNYSSELNNTYKQSGDRHMFKASELHLQGNLCDELNKVNVIEQ